MYEIAGKKIPSTVAEMVEPARTALLIWDMEYAIGPNAFNYQDMLPKLKDLSALARRVGVRVFYSVQTGFDVAKEEAGVWVRIRMKRAKASDPSQLLKEKEDPHDREIIAELKPQPQDIVFQKRRPDGFVGTDFDLMLRSNGIKTIVMSGVATEGGIEGTARSARNLGYDVVIVKDCVGSRNQDLHDMALKLMERTFFDVTTAGEIAAIWGAKVRVRGKTVLTLTLSVFLGSFSAHLHAADEKTLELAKKEARVSFYTSMAASESKLLADAFQVKYPFLRVDITRLSSDKLLQRILTENRAGTNLFDAVTNSTMEVHLLRKGGLLARYASPEAQAFFADSKDPAGHWADMYSNLRVITYNTRLVSKERIPKRYEDLLDPVWKGQIGFPEGQYAWYATMLGVMGEENGKKFMQALGRQNLQYRNAPVLITQFVAAGEFNLGLVYENQVLRFKNQGAPLGLAPLPFVTKNMHPLALSAAAPHPNAGKLFIDFVLSKEGQLLIKNLGRVVSRTDIQQDEFARIKIIAEDVSIADRIQQVMNDYKKYLE